VVSFFLCKIPYLCNKLRVLTMCPTPVPPAIVLSKKGFLQDTRPEIERYPYNTVQPNGNGRHLQAGCFAGFKLRSLKFYTFAISESGGAWHGVDETL